MTVFRAFFIIPAICLVSGLTFSASQAEGLGPGEPMISHSILVADSPPGETPGTAPETPKSPEKSEAVKPPSGAGPSGSLPASPEEKDVAALKKRIIELQNRGKLGFRKLVMCSSVDRFGVYSPVKPGRPVSSIILYIEPSNYGTLITKDRFIIDCTVDLAIFRGDGKLIGGKKGILRINRVSRSPILDLFYRIQVNLKKPLKSDIVIRTRLRDNVKNDTATATYRINMKSGEKKVLSGV